MKATIASLKIAAEAAAAAYEAEAARLVAAGLKSKERYEALRPLKAEQEATWAAYHKAAANKVVRGFRAIAEEANAEKRAAKLARSPYQRRKAAGIAARKAA